MHATNYMSCPVSGFGIFPRIEILSRLDWVKLNIEIYAIIIIWHATKAVPPLAGFCVII